MTADDSAMAHLRGPNTQVNLNESAACGTTLNAQLQSGSDCASVTTCLGETRTRGQGRIYRDGVASECDPPKPCPGTYATSVNYGYDIFEFNFDDEAGSECTCLDVDFDTGTCGYYVHGISVAGIYAVQAANFACTGTGPDNNPFEYIGDVGSSLTQPFSGPFTKVVNRAGLTNVTFVGGENYSGATGCSYSFTLNCGMAQSLQCLILPPLELIEEKLDNLSGN
jgi:hypothetical protein